MYTGKLTLCWYSTDESLYINFHSRPSPFAVLNVNCPCYIWWNGLVILKDNSTMYKTETQIVSYGIFYLNPSSQQCQPWYKKYIAVQIPPKRHITEALGAAILASKQAVGATKSLAVTLLLMTNSLTKQSKCELAINQSGFKPSHTV